MRVLHVISSIDPKTGGPAAALVGLARAQVAAGCRISLLATYTNGFNPRLSESLKGYGVEVSLVGPAHGVLDRHRDLPNRTDELVRACDVIHIHAMWEEVEYLAARAAQKYKKPYVITPCSMLMRYGLNFRNKWAKKALLAFRLKKNLLHAAAIHYATEVEREESLPLPTRIIIEPNGINLDEFCELPKKGSFRERYPQIGDKPLVVFLGRIHRGKGMEHLLPALSLCSVKIKDVILAAVGPDSQGYKAVLEQQVTRLGIRDRVLFTGALYGKDKLAALVDADLFCLPSDSESFSVATIEALACGTPVLISDKVGVKHEVTAAGVGEAVLRQPEILGTALSKWLSDKSVRESAAGRARAFVWKTYDWNIIARRWMAHYESFMIS